MLCKECKVRFVSENKGVCLACLQKINKANAEEQDATKRKLTPNVKKLFLHRLSQLEVQLAKTMFPGEDAMVATGKWLLMAADPNVQTLRKKCFEDALIFTESAILSIQQAQNVEQICGGSDRETVAGYIVQLIEKRLEAQAKG